MKTEWSVILGIIGSLNTIIVITIIIIIITSKNYRTLDNNNFMSFKDNIEVFTQL